MESWLTILLGLALLVFQGYSEKKKKEAAKAKRNITSNETFSNEPFFFTNEPEPELEPDPIKEIHEDILDTPQSAHYKPIDVVEPDQDNISSGEIKDVVETIEKPFITDSRQLVIFSEIMKPKYLEQ